MDNQIQENLLEQEFILPEGYEEEEVTPDEPKTEEPKEDEKEEVEQEQPFDWASLNLKMLDSEKHLSDFSPEEVQALVQKGADYGRIRESHDNYKEVKEVAKLYGYDPKELVEALKEQHFKNTAEANGTSVDRERESYMSAKEKETLKQEVEKLKQETSKQSASEEAIANLLKTYPDVDPSSISKEVTDMVAQGMDLTTAYTLNQNKLLQQQLKQAQQEASNAASAPISGGTSSQGTEKVSEEDDFLAGLNGNY